MAYPTGIRSPREETAFTALNRNAGPAGASHDGRGQLHRRFTTNNIPTLSTPLSPIGQQRRQAAEPTEYSTAVSHDFLVHVRPDAALNALEKAP